MAAEVDRYFESRRLKRAADRTSRGHGSVLKEACAAVVKAADGSQLIRLPDGRNVQLHHKERHCKAQPARDDAWFELELATETA